ncbi:hypothetical protein BC832DRAFT_563767 [Gaertneriomyces semiglobifer]|nr:hypothetical protein BC832DRAFT_563767 [Gaertneriomyces semiglobifer]
MNFLFWNCGNWLYGVLGKDPTGEVLEPRAPSKRDTLDYPCINPSAYRRPPQTAKTFGVGSATAVWAMWETLDTEPPLKGADSDSPTWWLHPSLRPPCDSPTDLERNDSGVDISFERARSSSTSAVQTREAGQTQPAKNGTEKRVHFVAIPSDSQPKSRPYRRRSPYPLDSSTLNYLDLLREGRRRTRSASPTRSERWVKEAQALIG